MLNLIERYYDLSSLNEWERLERHRLEYAVTLRALRDHLPPAPAMVLDCGGGPGRYAIELARQGYAVTLFDLSAGNLSVARTQAHAANATLAGYEQGNAIDLSRFADNLFEAVLLMGPLYHLTEAADREAALREAHRVLKPGGVLVSAFISYYAALRYYCKYDPEALLRDRERIEGFWGSGTFLPVQGDGTEFLAHFIRPTDVRPPIEAAGFRVRTVLAAEGLASMIDDKLNAAQGELWEAWVDLNYRVAADPSLHGGCEHLLAIAEK